MNKNNKTKSDVFDFLFNKRNNDQFIYKSGPTYDETKQNLNTIKNHFNTKEIKELCDRVEENTKIEETNENKKNKHELSMMIFEIVLLTLSCIYYVVIFCLSNKIPLLTNIAAFVTILLGQIVMFLLLCFFKKRNPGKENKNIKFLSVSNIIIPCLLLIVTTIMSTIVSQPYYLIISLISAIMFFLLPILLSNVEKKIEKLNKLKNESDFLLLQIVIVQNFVNVKPERKHDYHNLVKSLEYKYLLKRSIFINYYRKIYTNNYSINEEAKQIKIFQKKLSQNIVFEIDYWMYNDAVEIHRIENNSYPNT